MPRRLSALLAVAVLALCHTSAIAQGPIEYSSTTTISGASGSINGDISATISITYTECPDNTDGDGTYSASVNSTSLISFWGVDGSGGGYGFDSGIDFNQWFGPGTYTISAIYNGFGIETCGVYGSNASATVVVPGPQASAVTTSVSPTSAREGQPVAVTATVTSATGYETGPNPTGTVVLFYGSSILASKSVNPLNTSSGEAGAPISSSVTFDLSSAGIAPGTYTLNAAYAGDTNLTSSSSPVTVTITAPQVSTSTALTLAPTTLTEGASATLTATVTPSVSGITPTGTVTFYSGTMNLGHASLNSSGVASIMLSTKGISPGTYPITANYGGDSYDYASASSGVKGTIQAVTTTALAANPTTIQPGATVDFTATVARSGATGTPTGTVSFELGGYAFGTSTLNSKGVATLSFPTTNLGAGSYSIDAVYAGDTLDATSTSTPVTITVR